MQRTRERKSIRVKQHNHFIVKVDRTYVCIWFTPTKAPKEKQYGNVSIGLSIHENLESNDEYLKSRVEPTQKKPKHCYKNKRIKRNVQRPSSNTLNIFLLREIGRECWRHDDELRRRIRRKRSSAHQALNGTTNTKCFDLNACEFEAKAIYDLNIQPHKQQRSQDLISSNDRINHKEQQFPVQTKRSREQAQRIHRHLLRSICVQRLQTKSNHKRVHTHTHTNKGNRKHTQTYRYIYIYLYICWESKQIEAETKPNTSAEELKSVEAYIYMHGNTKS